MLACILDGCVAGVKPRAPILPSCACRAKKAGVWLYLAVMATGTIMMDIYIAKRAASRLTVVSRAPVRPWKLIYP